VIRLFKHYVPTPLLVLGILDYLLLFASADAAWRVRSAQIGVDFQPLADRIPDLVTYTVAMGISMLAVGLYQADSQRSWRMTFTRLAVAFFIGLNLMSVIFFLVPAVALWRSIAFYAILFSLGSLLLARAIFGQIVSWDRFRRKVVVLGAGTRGAKLQALSLLPGSTFSIARFVRMSAAEPVVADPLPRDNMERLRDVLEYHRAEEVVLAMEERRNSLPVTDLLKLKISGIRVSEMSTFLERETGRVDLTSVSPSWLIFSDGFLGTQQLALVFKRALDVLTSALMLLLTSPILLVTAILIRLTSKGPIFYRQTRVGQFGNPFEVIKFRSMRVDAELGGNPKWAEKDDPRITAIGRVIRATRIDEVPQILNVLKGEMSFVGPRPERPYFVSELSAAIPFYDERHVVKPGITGWAQLNYPYGASVDDARQKLEYDLYYIKNYSPFLDLLILVQTVRVILWRDGVR
jgi:sugar transferase (PEP-CTERM system associated)